MSTPQLAPDSAPTRDPGPRQCRYPLWGDTTPSRERLFCGAPSAGSWCPFHRERGVSQARGGGVTDHFRIEGPALVQFSGGRTSAYMLWRILRAHSGTLPDDVRVAFENTGKEMPETLDFIRDCGERWGVPISWLEYRWQEGKHDFAIVDHATASRNGEPFELVIRSRSMLPNPVARFCTIDMKIRTGQRYMKSLGWPDYTSVVGLRADEPRRVAKAKARSESSKDRFDTLTPLASAGITKRDVAAFWEAQNWGLALPSVNGTTPLGNCDLCFLKSAATIGGIIRDRPALAQWWIDQESAAVGKTRNESVAYFRKDRPSYAAMLDAVQRQGGARLRRGRRAQRLLLHG